MAGRTFRQLIRRQGPKIGTYVGEFATPGIGQILRSAGCEFVFLDMEHSGFTYETVKTTLRHIHDAGLASVVRPPSQAYHHVARACDAGAQGVVPPMLGTADAARRLVSYIKYVPQGGRGVALAIAHDDYTPGPVFDALAAANRKTSLVALIETAEGVENVDEIAAVEGLDCLWIGHFDLTCALGIPGEFTSRKFKAACQRVADAAKKHRKSLARMVTSPGDGAELYSQGYDVLAYSGDVWLLRAALNTGITELRAKIDKRQKKVAATRRKTRARR